MFNLVLFTLKFLLELGLIESNSINYSNFNTVYFVVELLNNSNFNRIIQIVIKHSELKNSKSIKSLLKVLIDNPNNFVLIDNQNLLLQFIYYLNEFKDFKLSYKKDLLNYNPNTYCKSFKFRQLYLLNVYNTLHFKNSNDSKNTRLFIVNKKLWNEFIDFKTNNSLFLMDLELSYIYSKDKRQLDSIKNYNLKIDLDSILNISESYFKSNSINMESFLELEYFKNSKNQNYIKYVIDYVYNYNGNFKDFDSFIHSIIDFLNLDSEYDSFLDSETETNYLKQKELITFVKNNSIESEKVSKEFKRFLYFYESYYFNFKFLFEKVSKDKENGTNLYPNLSKFIAFVLYLIHNKRFKFIDLMYLESLHKESKIELVKLHSLKSVNRFMDLIRIAYYPKPKKDLKTIEKELGLNESYKKSETIKKILR